MTKLAVLIAALAFAASNASLSIHSFEPIRQFARAFEATARSLPPLHLAISNVTRAAHDVTSPPTNDADSHLAMSPTMSASPPMTGMAGMAGAPTVSIVPGSGPNSAVVRGARFLETFTGTPSQPAGFASPAWTVNVASRDPSTWASLEPMAAQHGPGCEGPTHTHQVTSYDDAVFLCADHVMTAMNATGYGVIYLTPDALVDFSQGTASVRFDVSTFRGSGRDWIDLWVSDWRSNLALPFNSSEGEVDLQGAPRNAVHFQLDRGCSGFAIAAYVDGVETLGGTGCWEMPTWNSVLKPDSARRDTIEAVISKNHVKLWMPDYNLVLAESDVDLHFTQGVIQLGHHSYNPEKDCGTTNSAMDAQTCGPTTWHWDNVAIEPAVPFNMNHGDRRMVDSPASVVAFARPADAGGFLRFSAVGTVELSFDGGKTWQRAQKQASVINGDYHPEHASSYWHPVPTGATRVQFRFSRDQWYRGPFHARDVVVWSR